MAARKKTKTKASQKKTTAPKTAPSVKGAITLLKQARKQAPVRLLSADERKRLAFPREGAEAHVRLLESLLLDHPDVLSAAAVAAGDLSAAWDSAEALAGLHAELTGFMQAVEDTINANRSIAWRGALDILAAARAAARKNADIREAIASTEAFLKTGPRTKAG